MHFFNGNDQAWRLGTAEIIKCERPCWVWSEEGVSRYDVGMYLFFFALMIKSDFARPVCGHTRSSDLIYPRFVP